MNRRCLFLVFLLATMTTGCATTIPTMAELDPAPPERIFSDKKTGEGSAELTILRSRAFAGSIIYYRILIDGRLAAQLASGEFVVLSIPAGERVIEVQHPTPTIGALGDSTTLRAEPNAKYYYRVNSEHRIIRLLRTTAESIK